MWRAARMGVRRGTNDALCRTARHRYGPAQGHVERAPCRLRTPRRRRDRRCGADHRARRTAAGRHVHRRQRFPFESAIQAIAADARAPLGARHRAATRAALKCRADRDEEPRPARPHQSTGTACSRTNNPRHSMITSASAVPPPPVHALAAGSSKCPVTTTQALIGTSSSVMPGGI